MPCPQNPFQVQLCILATMYILKAYMIKYKNKKRLNKKLSLSYEHLIKYTFLSHISVLAEIHTS